MPLVFAPFTTILITTPDPFSLSFPGTELGASYFLCRMLIEKATVAIRYNSNKRIFFLDRKKKDEQIILMSFAIIHKMRETSHG